MKLATVRTATGTTIGVAQPDRGTLLLLPESGGQVRDVVVGDLSLEDLQDLMRHAREIPLSQAELAAPLQSFNRDILCTGWNYVDHFYESKGKRDGQGPEEMPERPTFFSRGPGSVLGPNDPIFYDPDLSTQWDFEAELAVVVGKDGRSIREEDAFDYIFGYCVANDVSLRDVQRQHGGQWLRGKSIDGTMPFGPWIVTVDEVPDVHELTVECVLNDVVVQRASTSEMAFSIPRLISELSLGMTLRAGDLILTGTPSGIGNARTPQLFLKEGDRLVTRVQKLGELNNLVKLVDLVTPK